VTASPSANAGVFAADDSSLAIGGYEPHVTLLSYPDLAVQWRRHPLFGSACWGVQLDDDEVHCFGFDRAKADAHARPQDWGARLCSLDREHGGTRRTLELPAGNWRCVRSSASDAIVLYDVSESMGVIAIDARRGTERWRAPIGTLDKLTLASSDRLLGFTAEAVPRLVDLRLDDGRVTSRTLPRHDEARWTSAIVARDGYLLGGHYPSRDTALLAYWDGADRLDVLREIPLTACFTDEAIASAHADDEDCGFDLDRISALQWRFPDRVLVFTLGGHGEHLGACQGACAVGIFTLATKELLLEAIDDDDGCSGLQPCADGAFLLDCGGTLRVFTLTAPRGTSAADR
jgi:hypothetical protein